MALDAHQERFLQLLTEACLRHYGERLVSLVVFGSFGRGTSRPDSDLDLLVVADGLPDGRIPRVQDFNAVETALALCVARSDGPAPPYLSAIFKSRVEAERGSPLFLDMTEDARILFDRDAFMRGLLERLKQRLEQLGSRRIWVGSAWYWDLKPDFRPGEVIEL